MTRRFTGFEPPKARGLVIIHSAPVPLCPHTEWAISAVMGEKQRFDWTNQPAQAGTVRAEFSWSGPAGTGAALASKLATLERLRFEVVEEASPGSEGQRYAFTPSLGVFSATVGVHGDIMVHEERLKRAVMQDALGEVPLPEALEELLGTAWDLELDIFRHASDDAPVRWLHQVV